MKQDVEVHYFDKKYCEGLNIANKERRYKDDMVKITLLN